MVALLLPLGDSRNSVQMLADDLFNAAQLALFDAGQTNIILSIHDTKGTPEGARHAALAGLAHHADIFIGPLFSSSVQAVAPVLRGRRQVALAFSNDSTVAAHNIWLLGFLPEQHITRVVSETIAQGLTRFGALAPEGPQGAMLLHHLQNQVTRFGGTMIQTETYPPDAKGMFEPVRQMARFDQRKAAYAVEMERLTLEAKELAPPDTPKEELFSVLRDIAPELVSEYEIVKRSETFGEMPYDVVFMPEGGLALRNLVPLLPYFDIDPRMVKFIGTGLWDDPSLSREPPLHGGWYAAPAPELRGSYARRFEQMFARPAPRLSSIAYDAISLTARLAKISPDDPFAIPLLTDPNGFVGIDGILRLTPNGLNERGLAVQEITATGARTLSTAPASFVEYDRRLRAALALAVTR